MLQCSGSELIRKSDLKHSSGELLLYLVALWLLIHPSYHITKPQYCVKAHQLAEAVMPDGILVHSICVSVPTNWTLCLISTPQITIVAL